MIRTVLCTSALHSTFRPGFVRSLSCSSMTSSMRSGSPLLVTPKELFKLLKSPTPPKVLDASWHMPNLKPPRHGFTEFKSKRIMGAGFWDVDIIASKMEEETLPLQHMLPNPERFADACSRLGISKNDHVIMYDSTGVFSSPRALFTFKTFGHEKVSVLDGGLPRWIAEKLPIDDSKPIPPNPHSIEEPKEASFLPIMSVLLYDKRPAVESYFIADIEEHMTEYPVPELNSKAIRSYEEIVKNSKKKPAKGDSEVVLDARPAGRFHGTDPEPREGYSSGHMPHSLSVPFSSLLSAESSTSPSYKTMLTPAELEKIFTTVMGQDVWSLVKDGKRGVVTTCGSGMTAAVVSLGLELAGRSEQVGLYDESWTGYAGRKESKIVKS